MSRKSRRSKAPVPSVHVTNPISKIVDQSHRELPVDQRIKQAVTQQTHSHFQGPLPHPDVFRQYGEVVSDAPERILKVFEDDSEHARKIQLAALDAQKEDNRRVHWMAWSLIFGGYLLSVIFTWMGKYWLAGIILTTTLTGTIVGFLQNKGVARK